MREIHMFGNLKMIFDYIGKHFDEHIEGVRRFVSLSASEDEEEYMSPYYPKFTRRYE